MKQNQHNQKSGSQFASSLEAKHSFLWWLRVKVFHSNDAWISIIRDFEWDVLAIYEETIGLDDVMLLEVSQCKVCEYYWVRVLVEVKHKIR